jgi:hypothetical protein
MHTLSWTGCQEEVRQRRPHSLRWCLRHVPCYPVCHPARRWNAMASMNVANAEWFMSIEMAHDGLLGKPHLLMEQNRMTPEEWRHEIETLQQRAAQWGSGLERSRRRC